MDVDFLSGHSFPVEDGVQIAVAGDFTGDGHSDIVTSDSDGRVNLLEGDGAGRFSEGVLVADLGNAGLYAEVTDLDNDGALDLLFPILVSGIAVAAGDGRVGRSGDAWPCLFLDLLPYQYDRSGVGTETGRCHRYDGCPLPSRL